MLLLRLLCLQAVWRLQSACALTSAGHAGRVLPQYVRLHYTGPYALQLYCTEL
jgi:hypothetical protein